MTSTPPPSDPFALGESSPAATNPLPCPIDTLELRGQGGLVAGDELDLEVMGWAMRRREVPAKPASPGRPARGAFTVVRAWNEALGIRVVGSPWRVRVSITSVPGALRGRGDRSSGISEAEVGELIKRIQGWLPLTTDGLGKRGGWQVVRIDLCRDVRASFQSLRAAYRHARSPRFRKLQTSKFRGYMRWGGLGGCCLRLYDIGWKLRTSGHEGSDVPEVDTSARVELMIRHPGRRAWFSEALAPAEAALPGELVVGLFAGIDKPPVRAVLRFGDLWSVLRAELSKLEGDEGAASGKMNRDRLRRLRLVVDGIDDGEQVVRGERAIRKLWRDPATRASNRNIILQRAKAEHGIRLSTLASGWG